MEYLKILATIFAIIGLTIIAVFSLEAGVSESTMIIYGVAIAGLGGYSVKQMKK